MFKESENYEKPPIGLKPRYIHDAQRHREVKEAMLRYIDDDRMVPIEWWEEYNYFLKPIEKPEVKR
mgnify:CR=1 FL=1